MSLRHHLNPPPWAIYQRLYE